MRKVAMQIRDIFNNKILRSVKCMTAGILVLSMVAGFTGCQQNSSSQTSNQQSGQGTSQSGLASNQSGQGTSQTGQNSNQSVQDGTAAQNSDLKSGGSGSKILVAYFSYFDNTESDKINSKTYADAMSSASVTIVNGKRYGNNDIVADIIRQQTGADVFAILTEQQYSPDYDGGIVSQAREDGKNKTRPALSSHISNLDQYDTVILLYPIWWYDMPMAVYTFFDEYNFAGKTIAPVATSGGSGLVDTVNSIKSLEPDAKVTEGLAISQTDVVNSGSAISSWLNKIGINR